MTDDLKATIFDWFQYREVTDEDRFNVYFNRVLNRDLPTYEELLRIQPGYAAYDWLVEEYLELQRTHEGENSVTRTGNSKATKTGTVELVGANSQTTSGTNGSTTTDSNKASDTYSGNSSTEREGKETTRDYSDMSATHGTQNRSGNYTGDFETYQGAQTVTNGFSDGKNKWSDKLTKTGSEIHATKSGDSDGSTTTNTKNGTREVTHKGAVEGNYDEETGSVEHEKTGTETRNTSRTPNLTDTTKTKNNQSVTVDNKQINKTLPMSSGSGDLSGSGDGLAGSNVPGFNWTDASAMGETEQTTAYTGDADTQTAEHTGSETGSDSLTFTGRKDTDTYNQHKTAHATDTTETEKFTDYQDITETKEHTDRTDTTSFNGYTEEQTHQDTRETVQKTNYPTLKANEHYEEFDTKHETSFDGRKDVTADSHTDTTESSGNTTTNGTTSGQLDATNSQTTTNNLTDETNESGSENGTNSELEREQHTGRHGEPAEILRRASEFIKSSNAWIWLQSRLEVCFIQVL